MMTYRVTTRRWTGVAWEPIGDKDFGSREEAEAFAQPTPHERDTNPYWLDHSRVVEEIET